MTVAHAGRRHDARQVSRSPCLALSLSLMLVMTFTCQCRPTTTEIGSNGRDDLTVKCRSLAGWLGGECQSRRSMDDSVE